MKQICVKGAWLALSSSGQSEIRMEGRDPLPIDPDNITRADIARIAEWAGDNAAESMDFGIGFYAN